MDENNMNNEQSSEFSEEEVKMNAEIENEENVDSKPVETEEYNIESIRQLKKELRELKQKERENRRNKKKSERETPKVKNGVSIVTVIVTAFVFTFIGFLASVVFSIFGNTIIDSIAGQKKPDNKTPVVVDSGPDITIDVDDIDTVTTAVFAKASKSVVGIRVVKITGMFWEQTEEPLGEGSGVIYSENGYVITNAHVIKEAIGNDNELSENSEVRVFLKTDLSEFYTAELIGYDTVTDLAVLKINVVGLKPIEFANSDDITIGEIAIAIGSPGGLEFMNSISEVIISGINRNIAMEEGSAYDLLQTDAAINPGNSGGALLNKEGKLIGISAIKIVSTDYEGMGFAIASNTIKDIVAKLIDKGNVTRPLLGVTVNTEYNITIADKYGYPSGAYVYEVVKGTCADKAGIKENDIITEINGVKIISYYELRKELLKHNPGEEITVKIYRINNKKTYDLKVVLDEAP